MTPIPYTEGLHRLGPSTWAYLQPSGSWGLSNCGVVADRGEVALVDTAWTLELTRRLLKSVEAELPGATITSVVNTHPNGDHCWGNQLLGGAQIVASAATADGMADEIGPAAMATMQANTASDSPLGAYMRRFFHRFDFSGIELTPANRTFTGATTLTVGDVELRLTQVGPAHTEGDVIAYAPTDRVVFAGDILFIGDHPVMWSGPIANWIAACDRMLALDAQWFVPGHGPVTGRSGVAAFRSYLEHVAEHATRHYRQEMPYYAAAAEIAKAGYADWGHPERLVVTVAGIYRELGWEDPASRIEMIEQMARLYWRLQDDPAFVAAAS
jgi:glyoxylase-like metal-dependent hydrolase (beta-lactamase superfamily II)